MIAIRFLVFFYDEKEDRSHRLAAVTPLFSSPSAVKTLMKTAKFEKRPAIVVTGEKQQLEKLVKKVERLDVTEWLSIEQWEPLREKLVKAIESIEGLSVFDCPDEQIVFGDDENVALAGKKLYPPDLPPSNQDLWDEIYKLFRDRIKGDEDQKAAIHRRLYCELAKRKGIVPWVQVPQGQKRKEVAEKIVSGEAKAQEILARLLRHATSEGLIKKAKPLKYFGARQELESVSRLCMSHMGSWTLSDPNGWSSFVEYIVKKEAFQKVGPRMIQLKVNQVTDVEIYGASGVNTVTVYISQKLTHAQATDLIGFEVGNPVKELNRIGELWHDRGSFPYA